LLEILSQMVDLFESGLVVFHRRVFVAACLSFGILEADCTGLEQLVEGIYDLLPLALHFLGSESARFLRCMEEASLLEQSYDILDRSVQLLLEQRVLAFGYLTKHHSL